MIQWIISIILILDVCTNTYDKYVGEGGGMHGITYKSLIAIFTDHMALEFALKLVKFWLISYFLGYGIPNLNS